jgi:hypothetical protein
VPLDTTPPEPGEVETLEPAPAAWEDATVPDPEAGEVGIEPAPDAGDVETVPDPVLGVDETDPDPPPPPEPPEEPAVLITARMGSSPFTRSLSAPYLLGSIPVVGVVVVDATYAMVASCDAASSW